jgi:excisionase family DNA binding protein
VADLLTTKELQDLLRVDRTTIYRMLKDGRITGVRVGNHWRFSREEIESSFSSSVSGDKESERMPTDVLPLHCVRPIQQVFAEIAQVGSLTVSPDGQPLTDISNSCEFCSLILKTKSGRRACIASWKMLAEQSERKPRFVTCHAGLQYARARIEVEGQLTAMVIAGQFYTESADLSEQRARVKQLAASHNIDPRELESAADLLSVLDKRHVEQIGGWLEKVANTFEQVAHERAALMSRLRRIADMSTLSKD